MNIRWVVTWVRQTGRDYHLRSALTISVPKLERCLPCQSKYLFFVKIRDGVGGDWSWPRYTLIGSLNERGERGSHRDICRRADTSPLVIMENRSQTGWEITGGWQDWTVSEDHPDLWLCPPCPHPSLVIFEDAFVLFSAQNIFAIFDIWYSVINFCVKISHWIINYKGINPAEQQIKFYIETSSIDNKWIWQGKFPKWKRDWECWQCSLQIVAGSPPSLLYKLRNLSDYKCGSSGG